MSVLEIFSESRWFKAGFVGLLLGASIAFGSCSYEDIDSGLNLLGLTDSPVTPLDVSLLVDPSDGAGGTQAHLAETLERILPELGERPGSSISVWALGATVGQTKLIGVQTVPAVRRNTRAARRLANQQFVETANRFFHKAGEPFLSGDSRGRRTSPLIESVSKIALSNSSRPNRSFLVLLTDGRQVSKMDWECGPLPSSEELVSAIHEQGLLTPGSLSGVRVLLTYMDFDEIPRGRCQLTIARDAAIRELWQSVLTAADAASVEFLAGPISVNWLTENEVAP